MFQLKEQTIWWKNSTRKSQETEENSHHDNMYLYAVEQTSDACGRKRQNTTRRYRMKPWSILVLTTLVVTSVLPNYAISAPLDFNFDVAESNLTESRGNTHEREVNSYTREDMEHSAKEFLEKFGYVKPSDWNNVFPRSFEESDSVWDIIENKESHGRKESFEESGSQEQEEENDLPVVTWSIDGISEADYQQALLKYQRINGLNETGELDSDTSSYMGRPRCGVPDRTAALKANRTDKLTELTTRTTLSTTTTTTGSQINATVGLWATSFFTDTMGTAVSATNATSTTGIPFMIHSTTTLTSESSGDRMGLDGSGSYPDQEILRRKRSELTESQMEVEFDDVITFPPEIQDVGYDDVRLRQLGFKEFQEFQGGSILEAELPNESRISDLEGILEALRQEKLSQMNATRRNEIFNDVVGTIRPPPAPTVPNLVRRMVMETRTNRKKRSTLNNVMKRKNGWLMAFPKPIITWRLVDEWPTKRSFMTSNEIWFTVKLAFRMWSEILPRNFREDNTSPMTNVDILLGFGKKRHNHCPIPFYVGNFTKEYAHAWPLPEAEIHFNDDQPFVSVSWEPVAMSQSMTMDGQPISLLKVALHEIGHTLGLPHNQVRTSIMNPVHTPSQTSQVMELQAVDRRSIQQVYGRCDINFNAVFDWVRSHVAPDGSVRWKYNTYFFRSTWFWLYENRAQRPRFGDPKFSSDTWRGVFDESYGKINGDPHRKIDGVVHIRDWNMPSGPVYFFSGDTYTEYDSALDKTKTTDSKGNLYPRKIKDGFPGIPSPIDTVFYKMTERRLYFFKDYLVYKYDSRTEKVESIEYISRAFQGWGGASPLPSHIDAAYYSITDSAHYFFKGVYFWKMADGRERHYNKGIPIPENSVGPKRKISSKWYYVCDVDQTEMQMSLRLQKP